MLPFALLLLAAAPPVPPGALREVVFDRAAGAGERAVRARLIAFHGQRIDDALTFFLAAVQDGAADLVVWAGHDRLMDVPAPRVARARTSTNVAVLACESERWFGPVLAAMGAFLRAAATVFAPLP